MLLIHNKEIRDCEVSSDYVKVRSSLILISMDAYQECKNITLHIEIRLDSDDFWNQLSYDSPFDISNQVMVFQFFDGEKYHTIKDAGVWITKIHFDCFQVSGKVNQPNIQFTCDLEKKDLPISVENTDDKQRMISLLQAVDDVILNYSCGCEHTVMEEFSFTLSRVFPSIDFLSLPVLEMIGKMKNNFIFTDSYYFVDLYEENEIRKEIAYYLEKKCHLYFDYETVKKQIKNHDILYTYLSKEDQNNLEYIHTLVEMNPKVILHLDIRYCTETFILEQMKKSDFVSSVFAGKYGIDSALYRYSSFYKKNLEIQKLLMIQLQESLKSDLYQYVQYSLLAKNNVGLAKIVLETDPSFIAYVGDDIRKNKEIMLSMLRQDKKNIYYVNDELKRDKDIMQYMDMG